MLRRLAILTPILLLAVGCSIEESAPLYAPSAPARIERLATRNLPNAVRVHRQVISGGLSAGDAAFAELRELGIQTIISVDGAKPDVALAEKYGLRYVHLPHGYDGVPQQRARELAKAVRDLPGPIYIHCHHGYHRSPAAAAVACVGAGFIGRDEAATVLNIAGTSEHYRGLFQSAQSAEVLDRALLDELECEFPATAKLPAMAEAMVAIEQTHDHLQALERAGWTSIRKQPDLAPEHEALLLREHFTELLRMSDVRRRPEEFQKLLRQGERLAVALEAALRAEPIEPALASRRFQEISSNCLDCHQSYRDLPSAEAR